MNTGPPQALVFYLALAIPMLLSLSAVATGVLGFLRARELPSGRGRTQSIIGMAFGAFAAVVWMLVLVAAL